MTREQLIRETRRLIEEGERLQVSPSLGGLRLWLQLSDELLSAAWGSMDRYHLSWLMVGRPKDVVRGRAMTADEEAAYVREVASQKTAALRMSLKAAADGRDAVRGGDARPGLTSRGGGPGGRGPSPPHAEPAGPSLDGPSSGLADAPDRAEHHGRTDLGASRPTRGEFRDRVPASARTPRTARHRRAHRAGGGGAVPRHAGREPGRALPASCAHRARAR